MPRTKGFAMNSIVSQLTARRNRLLKEAARLRDAIATLSGSAVSGVNRGHPAGRTMSAAARARIAAAPKKRRAAWKKENGGAGMSGRYLAATVSALNGRNTCPSTMSLI